VTKFGKVSHTYKDAVQS